MFYDPLKLSIALPYLKNLALYLNKFRGKPAITKFDKPFTPNHKSSQHISTCLSSALHYPLE